MCECIFWKREKKKDEMWCESKRNVCMCVCVYTCSHISLTIYSKPYAYREESWNSLSQRQTQVCRRGEPIEIHVVCYLLYVLPPPFVSLPSSCSSFFSTSSVVFSPFFSLSCSLPPPLSLPVSVFTSKMASFYGAVPRVSGNMSLSSRKRQGKRVEEREEGRATKGGYGEEG